MKKNKDLEETPEPEKEHGFVGVQPVVRCHHLIDGIGLINLEASGLLEMFTDSQKQFIHIPMDTKFTLLVNGKPFQLKRLTDYFPRKNYDMDIIQVGKRLSSQHNENENDES